MQQLPLKIRYCDDEIACRFLRMPSTDESLIITIPGGPGLSGEYIDYFLINLSKYLNVNVGIIDLPNHGESVLSSRQAPLSYKDCIDLINETLNEIASQSRGLILFGQSFGARVAFDLLAASEAKIRGAFLAGLPYMFQMSEGMLKKIDSLDMSSEHSANYEVSFAKSWMKILPLYTYSPLPKNVFTALTSNIKLIGNEHILDDVPSIEISAKILSSKSVFPRIGILQGDSDGAVPDNNLSKLKNIMPYAHFFEIEECGHFPMVENPEKTLLAFSQFYFLL